MRLLFALLVVTNTAWPAALVISLRTLPSQATLQGARATQQFLAIAKYADGTERDVTAEAEWRLSDPTLAKFISPARVAPTADGLNWTALATCESTNNPRAVGSGGHYGLYQFSLSTWASVGGSGNPIDASPAEQTARAQMLYNRAGASQWGCGSHLFD